MSLTIKLYISVCLMCMAFNKSLANEVTNTIQVIFNQPQYAVGDTAYFALVGLDKQFKKKSVLTIRLLSTDGNSHFYSRVVMKDGLASSYLFFPDIQQDDLLTMVIIPEVTFGNEKLAYTINWVVSENGTIARIGKEKNNEICTQASMNIDSLVTVRSKVTIEIKGEKFKNIVMVAYNKQLFSDATNGICGMPDVVVSDSNTSYSQSLYFFRGRVFFSSGQPVRDSTGITFYLRNSNLIYKVFSKQDGFFEFPLFMDFQDDWIYYKVTHKNKPVEASLELEHLSISLGQSTIDSTDFKSAYGRYNSIQKAVNNSYQFFKHGDMADKELAFESDIEVDVEVDMRKYEPFNTMYDVFLNVVPMVKYRIGEPDQLRVFLKKSAEYGTADPLYIINGYMTENTDFVTKLTPKNIRRIGVLRTDNTLGRFGELGQNGIILIETSADVVVPGKNILFIKGITKQQNKPDTIEPDLMIPDLRASVFWWAGTRLPESERFSFYTSNAPGEYIIQTFLTVDEKTCSLNKSIQVSISSR